MLARVVLWARSSWCGHVAPWVAEPQQVRPSVAQGWMRCCTAGQRRLLAQVSPRFSTPHPATLPFPENFYLHKGVCRPLPPSAYTHLWENCWALSTCLVLGPGLVTEEWQREEQRWKMQHPAFRGLWLHRERQTRNQMKTVSCRDEGLDWVKKGASRARSRYNGRCPAPGRSPLSPTVALGSWG